MDSIIVADTGFPADNELIRRITTAFSEPINGITKMIGKYVILDGVKLDGTTVSAGSIIIEGEFLPFMESTNINDENFKIDIIEVPTSLFYDNGETTPLEAYVRRYAVGSNGGDPGGENYLSYGNFVRLENLATKNSTVAYGRAQTSTSQGETFYGDIANFQKLQDSNGVVYFRVTLNENITNYVPLVVNSTTGNPNPDAHTKFSINGLTVNSFEIWPEIPDPSGFYANYLIQIVK